VAAADALFRQAFFDASHYFGMIGAVGRGVDLANLSGEPNAPAAAHCQPAWPYMLGGGTKGADLPVWEMVAPVVDFDNHLRHVEPRAVHALDARPFSKASRRFDLHDVYV
jgi:hypothetical protein